jgi:cytidine deaminase
MLKNRETQIEMIVAVSQDKILVPCGRCREMMLQINKGNMNTKVILPEKRMVTLKELLPES